jgi:succinate dehydrogenase / fumarate reductase iron-sulfur subunit
MKVHLKVWRQKDRQSSGAFEHFEVDDIQEDMSFLEMLDVLNVRLEEQGKEPITFESDCREGICGACSLVINGRAHGPEKRTTACQLHMRSFEDGASITIEPWRAKAFPVLKDLMVDRGSLDRIIQAGGFISARTGSAPEANAAPIAKDEADRSMDAAQCIGCGACVAACPNASASLFTAAKIAHLAHLPQGQPERLERAQSMVEQMDKEFFGSCTNYGECQDACPKGISISFIAEMNKDFVRSHFARVKNTKTEVQSQ